MKKYKDLLSELPSKSVVVTYGQFNPPSTGHELLIKVVRKLAKQRKADHIVFVSSAQDKKNPLEISKKIQYLELMFPNTKFVASKEDFVSSLGKYKNVVAVTSADNVNSCTKMLNRGKFDTTEVVKAGQTDPDSDDKLIKLATKGNYQSFKNGLPTTIRDLDGKRLMNDIRIGLELEPIKEQINLVKDDLREKYFRGEIFNEGDIVESGDEVYKIIKRGSNHLLLQTDSGTKVSKWIQDVQLTEREFMLDEKLVQEADATSATGHMSSANKAADKAKDDSEKARLVAAQAEEKAKLVDSQKREMDNLKNQLRKEDSPVVNTKSKYNIAKSVMSLSDFRKSMAQTKPDSEEKEIADTVKDGLVGNAHLHTDHGMRHRKVKYHLGETYGRKDSYTRDYEHSTAGMGKRQSAAYHADGGANDEGHGPEKFKPRSTMDRPHTVHIGGKPWKKFSNGHQAHAAVRTLKAKGKEAHAVAHFSEESELEEARMSAAVKLQRAFERQQAKSAASRQRAQELLNPKKEEPKAPVKEETEEQQGTRKAQLKRFKDQAAESKLCSCQDIKEAQYAGLEKEDKPGKKATEFKGGKNAVTGKTVEGWKDEDIGFKHTKTAAVKEEFDDINEEELVSLVEADLDALTEEDFYEAYEDDELAIIDDETGEEIEAVAEEAELDGPALMEVLSRMERIKAKARMRRSQAKRERREKVALRQLSTPQVANKRARRMAVSALKKRLLRGQNPSKISVGQKERIERFIQQRRKIVDRLATRMVSRVKQVEKARMSHKKFTKPNNGVAF